MYEIWCPTIIKKYDSFSDVEAKKLSNGAFLYLISDIHSKNYGRAESIQYALSTGRWVPRAVMLFIQRARGKFLLVHSYYKMGYTNFNKVHSSSDKDQIELFDRAWMRGNYTNSFASLLVAIIFILGILGYAIILIQGAFFMLKIMHS